jgi:hypothetical protein
VDALVVESADRLGSSPERRLDYRRIRARITTAPPQSPAELASPRAPVPPLAERPALLAASPALLEEPEFRSWWPRPETAAPYLAALRELRDSPIVLSPIQQEERVRAILAEAVSTLHPPLSAARRLEATAFVLAESGRVEAARQALAVAATLRETPERASDIPLLQALVHQGLGAHMASAERERTAERTGALVVTPDEIRRAGSPSRPPRARG